MYWKSIVTYIMIKKNLMEVYTYLYFYVCQLNLICHMKLIYITVYHFLQY